jgi:hypothetical protein
VAVTVAELRAVLSADTKPFQRGMSEAETGMKRAGRTIQKGALLAGTAIAAGLGVAAKIGWDEFKQGALVTAQTNAVLESTGGIANVTAKQVDNLAVSLMKKTGVDDEAIASSENMLLTFTRIRNEVGAGNDIFDQATKATLDLSVATGKDLTASSVMVGKALNDPIRGLSALTRVGVTFSDGQRKAIERMVEAGDTMGAQKIMLKELTKEFGGSAEAAGKTLPGQLNILRETFANFAGELVGRVIPHLLAVVNFFREHTTLAKAVAIAVAGFTAALITAGAALFLYNSALGKGIVSLVKYLFLTKTTAGTTRAMAAAQWLLNVAMSANPIMLVVTALAALGLGLFIAWKKSKTFRDIVTGALNFVRDAALTLADRFLWTVSKILQGFEFMARQAFKIPIIGDKFKGLADDIAGAREKVEGLRKGIDGLKSKKVDIRVVLHGWDAIEAVRGIGRGDVELPVGPRRDVVSIGRWLQSLGFHVAEHPQFGGVSPGSHTAGSFHYSGRAIDVNWPVPSQEPAMLDRIMPLLRALNPLELLWRTAGHFDHLHLALARGGIFTKPWTGMVSVAERGRPEGFIPLSQPRAATALAGSRGDTHIHLYNHGVLGSENQVLAWLGNAVARWERQSGKALFG